MEDRYRIDNSNIGCSKLRHLLDKNGDDTYNQFLTFYPRLLRENGKLTEIKPIEDAEMVCNALNLYENLGKLKGKATKAELMDLFKKYGL